MVAVRLALPPRPGAETVPDPAADRHAHRLAPAVALVGLVGVASAVTPDVTSRLEFLGSLVSPAAREMTKGAECVR